MTTRAATKPASRTAAKTPATTTTAKQDDALHLWVVLSRAFAALQAHAAAQVAQHDLTLAEFGVLEALYHKGPLLLGEVQRTVLVSSGGMTFIVNRLEARGLVERRDCPEDRRARRVALTEHGRRLMARIFPEHAAVIRHAMEGLTQRERRNAAALLRTLGLAAAATPLPGAPD